MALIIAIDDPLSQVYCVRAYRLTIARVFYWLALLFLLTQIFISYTMSYPILLLFKQLHNQLYSLHE